MSLRHRLPRVIYLPTAPVVSTETLRLCLNQPSRQLLHTWRVRKNFPSAWREGNQHFFLTHAVVEWLRSRGCNVERL